ncbi:metal-dependent hydrolase [Halovivax limisalsi]|uniref:metal-dependent hydrolase n=1 Tax=Halovivax limisalsi TaxID=1453760 RepID=UPI001FFD9639|nr:metal-dependent hydrolase [Halovivax limisalsi]
MPSTLIHVGLAGLLGVALLGDRFSARAILVVLAAAAVIDLDTIVGMYWQGTHRAAFHNLFVVAVPALVLVWDGSLRERSAVRERWGSTGVRVGWVALVCVLFAHLLLDAFFNGINLFWPLQDQFYDLSGELYYSNQDGLVQTFVEFTTEEGTSQLSESTATGTTSDTHYYTGFDPGPGAQPDTERIYHLASSGELLITGLVGYLAVGYRILDERATAN